MDIMGIVDTLNKYAGLGAFVIAVVALLIQIWREKPIEAVGRHRIAILGTAVLGALLLVVPGLLIYQVAILIAVSTPGTATELVVRAATWATIIGAAWGIAWAGFLLPPLIRWVQQQRGGA